MRRTYSYTAMTCLRATHRQAKNEAQRSRGTFCEAVKFIYCTMVIGLGIITFRLHDCRSLKSKRTIVKSIIGRLRNNFNASVAEVGSNDIYDEAIIGFAVVGNDRVMTNSKIDKIFNLADESGLAEIINTEMEIINL